MKTKFTACGLNTNHARSLLTGSKSFQFYTPSGRSVGQRKKRTDHLPANQRGKPSTWEATLNGVRLRFVEHTRSEVRARLKEKTVDGRLPVGLDIVLIKKG